MPYQKMSDRVRSFLSREDTGECLAPSCRVPADPGRKYCPDHESTAASLGFELRRSATSVGPIGPAARDRRSVSCFER